MAIAQRTTRSAPSGRGPQPTATGPPPQDASLGYPMPNAPSYQQQGGKVNPSRGGRMPQYPPPPPATSAPPTSLSAVRSLNTPSRDPRRGQDSRGYATAQSGPTSQSQNPDPRTASHDRHPDPRTASHDRHPDPRTASYDRHGRQTPPSQPPPLPSSSRGGPNMQPGAPAPGLPPPSASSASRGGHSVPGAKPGSAAELERSKAAAATAAGSGSAPGQVPGAAGPSNGQQKGTSYSAFTPDAKKGKDAKKDKDPRGASAPGTSSGGHGGPSGSAGGADLHDAPAPSGSRGGGGGGGRAPAPSRPPPPTVEDADDDDNYEDYEDQSQYAAPPPRQVPPPSSRRGPALPYPTGPNELDNNVPPPEPQPRGYGPPPGPTPPPPGPTIPPPTYQGPQKDSRYINEKHDEDDGFEDVDSDEEEEEEEEEDDEEPDDHDQHYQHGPPHNYEGGRTWAWNRWDFKERWGELNWQMKTLVCWSLMAFLCNAILAIVYTSTFMGATYEKVEGGRSEGNVMVSLFCGIIIPALAAIGYLAGGISSFFHSMLWYCWFPGGLLLMLVVLALAGPAAVAIGIASKDPNLSSGIITVAGYWCFISLAIALLTPLLVWYARRSFLPIMEELRESQHGYDEESGQHEDWDDEDEYDGDDDEDDEDEDDDMTDDEGHHGHNGGRHSVERARPTGPGGPPPPQQQMTQQQYAQYQQQMAADPARGGGRQPSYAPEQQQMQQPAYYPQGPPPRRR